MGCQPKYIFCDGQNLSDNTDAKQTASNWIAVNMVKNLPDEGAFTF